MPVSPSLPCAVVLLLDCADVPMRSRCHADAPPRDDGTMTALFFGIIAKKIRTSRASRPHPNNPQTTRQTTHKPQTVTQATMPPASTSKSPGGKRDYDYLFKLVLIGDSGVGKSCLLLRFAVSYLFCRYRA